jgi:DNA-binding MarR family transcriptional regulator
MGEALKQRLRQAKFESPAHEAMLNLLVAAGFVRERLDRLCEAHGITAAQYNVLRILRGAHPGGYPRCDVAARMIERAPDVTRIIDRLQRRGLVERARSSQDRRLSLTRITRKGMDLAERMRPEVDALHREIGRRLSAQDVRELSRISERLYATDE